MKEVANLFKSSPSISTLTIKGSSARPPSSSPRHVVVPQELKSVAQTFVQAQELRHDADYNLARRITKDDAQACRLEVEQAIKDWKTVKNTPAAKLFLAACLAKAQG
jgi:hypothetical protein